MVTGNYNYKNKLQEMSTDQGFRKIDVWLYGNNALCQVIAELEGAMQ